MVITVQGGWIGDKSSNLGANMIGNAPEDFPGEEEQTHPNIRMHEHFLCHDNGFHLMRPVKISQALC
jgi:hypothetical protein